MAKKRSIIAGEYVISIADNGHVDVDRIPRNVKAALREIAASKDYQYDVSWDQRQFANKLLKEFGDGKTLVSNGYTVSKREDGGIDVLQSFGAGKVKACLHDIAKKVGYVFDDKWNTQHMGRNLVDYLMEHKEEADKILQTPNGKLKAVEEDMLEKESAACTQTAPNTESDINPSLLRRIEKDGKCGYAMDGKEIIPCIYDSIRYFDSGLFRVRKSGEGEGIINANNEVIVPLEYDSVYHPSGQGRMVVRKVSDCGLVDLTGKIVIPVQYREIDGYDDNEKYYIVRKDDFYGIIDCNGTIVAPVNFTMEKWYGHSTRIFEKEGKYYRFDSLKGSMVEFPYDKYLQIEEETNLVPVCKNGKWGYVNEELEEVVPCENVMCIVDVNATCSYDQYDEDFFDEKKDISDFVDENSSDLEDEDVDLSDVKEFDNNTLIKIFQSEVLCHDFTYTYDFERNSCLKDIQCVYWAEIPGEDGNWYNEWRMHGDDLEECTEDEIEVHNTNESSIEKGIHYMYSVNPIAYFFRLLIPDISAFDPSKLVVEDNVEQKGDCELKVSYDGKMLPFLWGSYEDSYEHRNRRLFIDGEEFPIDNVDVDGKDDEDEDW